MKCGISRTLRTQLLTHSARVGHWGPPRPAAAGSDRAALAPGNSKRRRSSPGGQAGPSRGSALTGRRRPEPASGSRARGARSIGDACRDLAAGCGPAWAWCAEREPRRPPQPRGWARGAARRGGPPGGPWASSPSSACLHFSLPALGQAPCTQPRFRAQIAAPPLWGPRDSR